MNKKHLLEKFDYFRRVLQIKKKPWIIVGLGKRWTMREKERNTRQKALKVIIESITQNIKLENVFKKVS